MVEFFAENFWGIGACGFLLATVLLFLLIQTGQRVWLMGAVIAGVLTLVLLLVEIKTVTVREEIAVTLKEIARDLESNDAAKILRHISPNRPELEKHAQRLLPRITFQRATVKSNLTVEPSSGVKLPQVTARFNAVLIASDRRAGLENQFAPFLFVVDFERVEDEWKVTRYEHHDPRGEAFDSMSSS
jgi:hypothetical protein